MSDDDTAGREPGINPAAASGIARAVESCRAVQREWARTPKSEALGLIRALSAEVAARAEDIARTVHSETGKPRCECYGMEVYVAEAMLKYCDRWMRRFDFSRRERFDPLPFSARMRGRRTRLEYGPLGVVGVIAPSNVPFGIAFTQVATAVTCGNAAVLKPSPLTPASGALIVELFEAAGFPAGLVALADPGAGEEMASCGLFDKIVFTGGTEAGRSVMRSCAESVTPIVLELGGRDAMVVLDDADVARAAEAAVWGSFANAGQLCVSVRRIYVHRSLYPRFLDELVLRAESLKIGDGWDDPDVSVGPLASAAAVEAMERAVETARREGGTIVAGGSRPEGLDGFYFEPTVVADVAQDSKTVQKGAFGPLVCVLPFDDEAEAAAMADGSPYALACSVWTSDAERGVRFAKSLRPAMASVNNLVSMYGIPTMPWSGRGLSGFGTTHGRRGFLEMMRCQAVHVDRQGSERDPWWMPYSGESAELQEDVVARVFGDGGRLGLLTEDLPKLRRLRRRV